MSIQDLRGTKSAKAQTLAAMVNKPGAWTSEDQSVYDAGMAAALAEEAGDHLMRSDRKEPVMGFLTGENARPAWWAQ